MRLYIRADPMSLAVDSTTAPPAQFAASAMTELPAALELLGRRVNGLEPRTRVRIVHRKRDEPEGHAIARRAELLGRSDAHRHHRPQGLGGDALTRGPQHGAERPA